MSNVDQQITSLIARAEEIEQLAKYADGQSYYNDLQAARELRMMALHLLPRQPKHDPVTVEIPFEILTQRNEEAAESARKLRVKAAADKMAAFFNRVG